MVVILLLLSLGGLSIQWPGDVKVYNQGLLIVDQLGHQLLWTDFEGNEGWRIGQRGEGPGEFDYPSGLFVDSRGIWLGSQTSKLQLFDDAGRFQDVSLFYTMGHTPIGWVDDNLLLKGVMFDEIGNPNMIHLFNPQTQDITKSFAAASPESVSNNFVNNDHLAIFFGNHIVYADAMTMELREYDMAGDVVRKFEQSWSGISRWEGQRPYMIDGRRLSKAEFYQALDRILPRASFMFHHNDREYLLFTIIKGMTESELVIQVLDLESGKSLGVWSQNLVPVAVRRDTMVCLSENAEGYFDLIEKKIQVPLAD